MRAVRYHEHGGADVLRIEAVDRPTPGPEEVLVETRAIGINHVDTLFREGVFTPESLPAIPGSDFAGVITEVGDRVTEYEVGDRVHGAGLGGDRPGTYAEYVAAPTARIGRLPDDLDFTEGAAMSHVGVAAWQGIVHHGSLEPADICLIHGGGGGLGHIAVQLAAESGATVITTEAAPKTRRKLEDLGADVTFDFRRDDLEDAVLEVGQPNLILDYHFDRYIEFDIRVLADDGRISVLEFSTEEGGQATLDQSTLRTGILKDVSIQLVSIFNADVSEVLNRLTALVSRGDLHIEIAGSYDLDEVVQAHHDITEEVHFGKLVFELE